MNKETKKAIQVWFILCVVFAICVWIAVMLTGCAAKKPVYIDHPKNTSIAENEPPPPPPPCTNCPPCDGCFTNEPLPPWNTNGLYLEVVFCNTVIPDTNFVVPFYVVTKANNLTNGHTYRWERTFGEISEGWIPLSSFVASTNFAYRTNGIPVPDHHLFRIIQTD